MTATLKRARFCWSGRWLSPVYERVKVSLIGSTQELAVADALPAEIVDVNYLVAG
jgi:hypothetical protein